jgi:RNA polymerase sigma-70 factor (ECF subfamily)
VSTRSGREYSDEDLVCAVQEGNDAVAAQVHARLATVIDRTLLRVFGRRELDHDDLMQAAFEQIVLTLTRRTYAGNCSLKTWAARVTANVGLNALRARRRERAVLDRNAEPTEGVSGGDLERASHARAQLRRVMDALSVMNRRRAQAVFLHDIEGYALHEISALTGVSLAAAQSRLVRGRRELLKRLDKEEKQHKSSRRSAFLANEQGFDAELDGEAGESAETFGGEWRP